MAEELDFNDMNFPITEGPREFDYNDMNFGEKVARDASMFGTLGESTARGFIDNMANVPNAIGDVVGNALAYPTAGAKTLAGMAMPESMKPRFNMATGEPYGGFGTHLEQARNTWPMSTLIGGMDAPTSFDAQAALRVAPQTAYQYRTPEEYGPSIPYTTGSVNRDLTDMGEQFRQYRDEALEGYIQRREEFPIAADTGDVLADVATLYTGRAPIGNYARQRRLMDLKSAKPAPPKMDPGFRRWATRKADEYKQWFKDSGYQIAETGVEGAMLAALQDEDPVTGAAFGVGVQAVNNVANKWWDELGTLGTKEAGITRTGLKAGFTAFALSSLFQIFKELTPGGRDRILESQESGYAKVAATMALGAMTNTAGFGRPSRTQLDDLGLIVDTWHSARRGATMSMFTEIMNDDSGDLDRITTRIFEDPSYFDATAMRRIARAMTDENTKMGDTVATLMESDRKFRRKVLALREQ